MTNLKAQNYFIIQDWMSNHLFTDKTFDSFDEAWSYIYENVEEEYEGDGTYEDYYAIEVEGFFNFQIDETIEVDQCYLDDEVTMNSKGISSRATIQSIPKDDEELVCIQYTSGLIDYVPQNIINKL